MKVSTTINAIRGVDELQQTLLELLFEVVPAERGAILLCRPRLSGAHARVCFSLWPGSTARPGRESIRVSSTVTHWVLNHGESLLINNQTGGERLRERLTV